MGAFVLHSIAIRIVRVYISNVPVRPLHCCYADPRIEVKQ